MKQKVLSIRLLYKVLLKKYKHNGEIEFAPVYFNSDLDYKTLLNKFCTELITGLMKDLTGLLN